QSSDRELRRQILERLFDVEQELYAAKFSRSQRLMERGQPVDLATLQQSLRADELILEYALGEPRSYGLVISDRDIRVITLPGRSRIEALVEKYLAEVRSRKAATQSAKELYSMLLGSVAERRQRARLIVVPDGRLHLIPFDALVDESGSYVLASHTVTYAPSAIPPRERATGLPAVHR
ncbi:MAG: CHAT domain-containing protein, partial [Bryobacteraceae bacterium]|nr:CHAT domain-containing protein [Bryobacteraceae bacterium]